MNSFVMTDVVDWQLLVISSGVSVGTVMSLNLFGRAKAMNRLPEKVVRVVRAKGISDHWKEKVLLGYARKLLRESATVFVLLFVAISPFFLSFVISALLDSNFLHLVESLPGICGSTVSALLFAKLFSMRKRKDYGAGSRMLHQLVLGSSIVGETLFDIEKVLHGNGVSDTSGEKHVFIAGLARAGTTIVMRTLYEHGSFLSLTYRDMPFIMAPNSWRACSKMFSLEGHKQERAHGDGIRVDYDSPEALEEVFWRTFCGSEYIKKDRLVPMEADAEAIEKFKEFVSIVLKSEPEKKYLSKNNNNILRLKSVSRAFPNAVIIVPFRDPVQQAYSLRTQHRKFVGEEDSFTGKYMKWLAHHEFGVHHRPFVFHENVAGPIDTDDLNYWVQLWVNTYSYVLENLPSTAILLSYEMLCEESDQVWSQLSQLLNLPYDNSVISFSKAYRQIDEDISSDLLQEAQQLYRKMSFKTIGCERIHPVGQLSNKLESPLVVGHQTKGCSSEIQ